MVEVSRVKIKEVYAIDCRTKVTNSVSLPHDFFFNQGLTNEGAGLLHGVKKMQRLRLIFFVVC